MITQKSDSLIDLGTAGLTIVGQTTSILLKRIKAGSINIKINSGNIHIYNADISGDSNIETLEGDVVFQTMSSFKLDWAQNENNFCLYAPSVAPSGSYKKSNCLGKSNSANNVDCYTRYLLCQTGDSCVDSSSKFTLSIRAEYGNVYANVISAVNAEVNTATSQYIQSINFTDINIGFDSNTNKSLTSVLSKINDTNKADPFLLFQLGNTRAYAKSGINMVSANNPAYLNIFPWWLNFLSLHLLTGSIFEVPGRISPGFCPFTKVWDINKVGKIKELIRSAIVRAYPDFRGDQALVYSPKVNDILFGSPMDTGTFTVEESFEFYDVSLDSRAKYQITKNSLSRSIPLVAALVLSLLLSVAICILLTYFLLFALDNLLHNYMQGATDLTMYSSRFSKPPGYDDIKRKEELINNKSSASRNEDENPLMHPENAKVGPSEDDPGLSYNNRQVDHSKVNKQTEMLKKEAGTYLIWKVLQRLPSQFLLLDLFVKELKTKMNSSSTEFIQKIFKEVRPGKEEENSRLLFSKVKIFYEQFCYLNQFSEENLLSEKAIKKFENYGFKIETCTDSTTEVLMKIRFATERERADSAIQSAATAEFEQDMPSLELFMNRECRITQFEEDTILLADFERKYENFCHKNRFELVPISKSVLLETLGLESNQKPTIFISRKPEERQVYYNIDFEEVEEEIKSLKYNSSDLDRVPTIYKMRAFGKSWGIYDFIACMLHVIVIAFMMIVPVLLPIYVQLEYSRYKISDERYNLQYEDFSKMPWEILGKIKVLNWPACVFGIISIIYGILAIADLIIYYRFMIFPVESFRNYEKMQDMFGIVGKVLQKVEWIYIFIVLAATVLYISLVLVWSILGAILNPNAYLAYAAGAGTFITYINVKYEQFKQLYLEGVDQLKKLLIEKLKPYMQDIMKKILTKAGFAADLTAIAMSASPETLKERAISFVASTPLGKKLARAKLDISTAIGLMKGDENAIIDLATRQGIPKNIVVLLLGKIF